MTRWSFLRSDRVSNTRRAGGGPCRLCISLRSHTKIRVSILPQIKPHQDFWIVELVELARALGHTGYRPREAPLGLLPYVLAYPRRRVRSKYPPAKPEAFRL
jgi:hypothetical protein